MKTQTRSLDWDIVLRDGATIHVRPFEMSDIGAVRAFLAGASPEALFARFFGIISIEQFDVASLDSTDPTSRCTLLAEAGGRVLAMATYVRRRQTPNLAEAGFLVAEGLQGLGLGTRLVELLADVARTNGVTLFSAQILRANERMRQVFHDVGFGVTERMDGDICHVTMEIAKTTAYLDRTFDRTRSAAASSMRALFEPVVVAMVGASRQRHRIGSEILHNLRSTDSSAASSLFTRRPKSSKASPLTRPSVRFQVRSTSPSLRSPRSGCWRWSTTVSPKA